MGSRRDFPFFKTKKGTLWDLNLKKYLGRLQGQLIK